MMHHLHHPNVRRTLSSPLTFFWKFAATPLLAGCFVFVMAAQWSDGWKRRDRTPVSSGEIAIATICLAVTFAWLVFLSARLKRVEVDDSILYISNYVTEIRVPLSEVINVRESWTLKWFLLGIDLRNSTAFGQHIDFRPRLRFYWSGLHPVARDLNTLCENAKGGNRSKHATSGRST